MHARLHGQTHLHAPGWPACTAKQTRRTQPCSGMAFLHRQTLLLPCYRGAHAGAATQKLRVQLRAWATCPASTTGGCRTECMVPHFAAGGDEVGKRQHCSTRKRQHCSTVHGSTHTCRRSIGWLCMPALRSALAHRKGSTIPHYRSGINQRHTSSPCARSKWRLPATPNTTTDTGRRADSQPCPYPRAHAPGCGQRQRWRRQACRSPSTINSKGLLRVPPPYLRPCGHPAPPNQAGRACAALPTPKVLPPLRALSTTPPA